MRSQTFVFFGQVGSGKGTQVKLLTDFLKAKDSRESIYAGTGDGFRKLIESGNYTAELVKEYVHNGILVPDFLTDAVFINILISNLSPDKNLIADGYPRTASQSIVFEEMMKFFKRDEIRIIYIELSEEEAMKRNLLRGRQDDTKEGLTKRFNEYKNKVVPAMNYFKDKEGYEIHTINGEQSIEDVHKDIIKALGY
ncbi:MAG: nucleoside monophosphate kinase [Minisyncoccia bacterium]